MAIKDVSWLNRRSVRVLVLLTILSVTLIAVNFPVTTPSTTDGSLIPTPEPSLNPSPQPPSPSPDSTPEQIKELILDGVIIRSSGDTNPFVGTPWICVSCYGYVGTPIIAADLDPNKVYRTLRDGGVGSGQNIIFTGQEDFPKGSNIEIFIQWKEEDGTVRYDVCNIVFDKKSGLSLSELDEPLVFLGSHICCGNLEAADTGCIGCTVNCPKAIFVPYKDNSGYLQERSRYYIPEGILPEIGTKVEVIVTWPDSID